MRLGNLQSAETGCDEIFFPLKMLYPDEVTNFHLLLVLRYLIACNQILIFFIKTTGALH